MPVKPKLRPINETRKPNGQLTSETAYRLKQRQAGLASARKRTDGFAPLIEAGRAYHAKQRIQGLICKLSNLGVECECMRRWLD